MIYPGKFGGIQLTGSRDIVGTRIFHADAGANANADTSGMRTVTYMSALTFGGGT